MMATAYLYSSVEEGGSVRFRLWKVDNSGQLYIYAFAMTIILFASGMEYELLYHGGKMGWVSLGRKTANGGHG
jgi:hypothetical protein